MTKNAKVLTGLLVVLLIAVLVLWNGKSEAEAAHARCLEAATSPRRSTVEAPPPTVATKPTIATKNSCMVYHAQGGASGLVAMLAVIPVTYVGPSPDDPRTEKRYSRRILWRLYCPADQPKCSGFKVLLDRAEDTGQIEWKDTSMVDAARVVSVTGSVATIKFGPYRTFTIDEGNRRISFSESGGGDPTEGRGSVECEPGPSD